MDDPDLLATFKDPIHLTVVPSTYEELERLDNKIYLQERYQKQIAASTGSTSGNKKSQHTKEKEHQKA